MAPLPPMARLPASVQFVRVTVVLALSTRIAPPKPWLPPSPNEPLNVPPMRLVACEGTVAQSQGATIGVDGAAVADGASAAGGQVAGEAGVADCRDHAKLQVNRPANAEQPYRCRRWPGYP